jgi:hypothetical protein
MPMIYTIVAGVLEKIQVDNENRIKRAEDERERLERERDEEEIRKFEGTKVTVESFLKWKIKFDQEQMLLKKQLVESGSKKPTGKQLFERDERLAESDLQLLDEGDNVEVDEALFQNLDDINLDDDGEEWKPDDEDDDDESDEEEND